MALYLAVTGSLLSDLTILLHLQAVELSRHELGTWHHC